MFSLSHAQGGEIAWLRTYASPTPGSTIRPTPGLLANPGNRAPSLPLLVNNGFLRHREDRLATENRLGLFSMGSGCSDLDEKSPKLLFLRADRRSDALTRHLPDLATDQLTFQRAHSLDEQNPVRIRPYQIA
jgi:hypothetical protein